MRKPIIAIGVDAAERRLVERLAGEGRLPAIAALAGESGWGTITSPAPLGSGAVWPTFTTGQPPDVHGFFGDHRWNPERMVLERGRFDHLVPFWSGLAAAGATVAVVDVPFAPVVGRDRLIEIADWGAHDWCGNGVRVHPPAVAARLADVLATPHPLAAGPVDSRGPGDVDGLRDVALACRQGADLRGDLAIRLLDVASPDVLLVVFPELHRASHLLWHTVDPAHPVWREGIGALPDDVMRGLADVLVAIDRQVGRLAAHGDGARAVVLFSLHGMQPARGILAGLDGLLEHWGLAVRRRWWRRPARRLAGDLARAGKRGIPGALKAAYYRRAPRSLTRRLSQPAMPIGDWDWSRTRAFSIPTDQHGWIRVNLAGREACGMVPASKYQATCEDLRARLLALRSPEGPLVRDVMLTAAADGRPSSVLPDLVVHWSAFMCRPVVHVVNPSIEIAPIGLKFVGQHADDGFFVGRGLSPAWPQIVETSALGGRIAALVRH